MALILKTLFIKRGVYLENKEKKNLFNLLKTTAENKSASKSEQDNKLAERLGVIEKQLSEIANLTKANYDRIPELRAKLLAVRQTKSYKDVFNNKKPLVSIRIATHNNADILLNRTIKSVLNQTYKNFEIVVVGDFCTDDTEVKIRNLNDHRIKYYNLESRDSYPENKRDKWYTAGIPPANYASQLASGDWIFPLDHDDEFTPDHIEKLLEAAIRGKFEMVYGKIISIKNNLEKREIWSFPPEQNNFGFQAAMYMRALNFFEYDIKSYLLGEPGDWNLCRRMLEAGVKIGAIEDVVGTIYPSGSQH